MSTAIRPRRSVLYMPGSNERALEKAKTIPADALIFDLEDAVAPDAKEAARDTVRAAVKAGGYGRREIIVRVNGIDTPWGKDDIAAVADVGANAVLVPKVNSGEDVRRYDKALTAAGAGAEVALWAMMETALAMLNAQSIAAVSKEPGARLSAWVMGTNDLAKEMSLIQTEDRIALITSLSLCVLAGKAYGLVLIDGVYNDIKNEDGFQAVCRQGREMGFDGKTLIHPSQVAPCNDIFAPGEEEVAFARKIIEAFSLPENKGKGALKVEGRMVELLHAEIAKAIVAKAEAIAAMAAE